MKAKLSWLALWACLALLLVLFATLTVTALEPEGVIITVCPPPGTGCDYSVIQEAIDHADAGDTIRVAQGVYTENLTVDKQVTLEGGYESSGWTRDVARYETIIDGSNSRTVRGDWDGQHIGSPVVLSTGAVFEMWYDGSDIGDTQLGRATSPDGVAWAKDAGNPLFGSGAEGDWDEGSIWEPFVLFDGGTYEMWYTADDQAIGYATSTNGTTWTRRPDPVLEAGPPGAWDESGVSDPYVIKASGTYTMWYESWTDTGRIGCATSPDGITWTKCAANPVLEPGDPGDWDETAVHDPVVVFHDGLYHMWYRGTDPDWVWHIGYITSTNGIEWNRFLTAPVLSGTPGDWDDGTLELGDVLVADGSWDMWYGANGQVGSATSTNGINWTKSVSNPLLGPGTPGQWGQPVVKFVAGSDGSALDGFTVRNGEAMVGGGILVNHARATIRSCTVISNTAQGGGGGIALVEAEAAVAANTILSNTLQGGGGGGILVDSATVTVTNNVIAFNVGLNMAWDGDGIVVWGDTSDVRITNNTIASNSAEGVQADGGTVLARNNIFYGNDIGIHKRHARATVSSDHNAFWNNIGGEYLNVTPGASDIAADPLFMDATNGDYHLQIRSPCIDAGTPDGAPATDIEGTPRDSAPDMGAYEWHGFAVYLPLVVRYYGMAGGIPTLITPEEGAVLDNGRTDGQDELVWDFDWSDCQGASHYQLYVIHPGAQNPVINEDALAGSSYHHSCPSGCHIVSQYRFGWTWKVRAKIGGQWGDWSETRTFDVEPVNTDPSSP